MLARDRAIEVAGPILSQSNRLTDEDLLAIARDNSQERLLAISKRATLSEKVSDVLVTRGNRDVVLSVTQNEGARFSDTGYRQADRPVDRRRGAGDLRRHAQGHSAQAFSHADLESVRGGVREARGQQSRRRGRSPKVLTDITGQEVPAASPTPSATTGKPRHNSISCGVQAGRPMPSCRSSPRTANFEETVAALVRAFRRAEGAGRKRHERLARGKRFCLAPGEGRRPVVADRKARSASCAGGPSRPAAAGHRNGPPELRAPADRDRAAVVRFYNERHTALTDFQRLAQQFHAARARPRALATRRDHRI